MIHLHLLTTNLTQLLIHISVSICRLTWSCIQYSGASLFLLCCREAHLLASSQCCTSNSLVWQPVSHTHLHMSVRHMVILIYQSKFVCSVAIQEVTYLATPVCMKHAMLPKMVAGH